MTETYPRCEDNVESGFTVPFSCEGSGWRPSGFWRVPENPMNAGRGIDHPREVQEHELAFSRMGNKNSRPKVRKKAQKEVGFFQIPQTVCWDECHSTGNMLFIRGTSTNIK